MPQTPKSISVPLSGSAVTAYTVPAGATAVLKTALAANVVGTTSNITVQKVSGGLPYPLIVAQPPVVTPATGGTAWQSKNLIDGPVTLAAGETISVFDNATPLFKFPQTSTQFIPTESSSYAARAMLFGNSIYVMVARDNTNNKSMVLRSTDANTWTEIATGNLLGLADTYFIARNGSTWVVGQYNSINYMYSTDNALTWTAGTLASGALIFDVESDGTRFVFCTNNGVYTATTLPTTTLNTTLNNYTQGVGGQYAYQAASWNGTYWFISNAVGTFVTTDFSTFTGLYAPFGAGYYGGAATPGVRWNSTYSRYYSGGRASSSLDAVASSTNGYTWTITNLTSNFFGGAIPRVNAVGSTLILKAYGSPGLYKSTNGTSWTSGSDIRNYTGMMEGLSNGAFISCQSPSPSASFYLTTDPATSTGNNFSPGSPTGGSVYYCCAASNGTGWAMAAWEDNAGNTYIYNGSSSTTYNSYNYLATGEIPGQMLWWPAASVYVLSAGTNIYTSTNGSSWSIQSGLGISGGNFSLSLVGSVLYAIPNNGASQERIFSLTAAQFAAGSAAWTQTTLLTNAYSNIQNGYRTNGNLVSPGGLTFATCGALASNGTDILVTTNTGVTWVYTPSVSNVIRTPGSGGVLVDRVNSLDIVYTGSTASANGTRGFFYGSNIFTALPSNSTNASPSGTFSTALTSSPTSSPNRFGSKVIFYGSTYYTTADNTDNVAYATNIKLWTTFGVSNQSIGGLNPVQAAVGDFPQFRIQTDGTNFLTYSTTAQRLTVYKGTTPLNTLASSTATLGLIEIT